MMILIIGALRRSRLTFAFEKLNFRKILNYDCAAAAHTLGNRNFVLISSFEHTVGQKRDSTKRYLWSKAIQTTGSVGGPEVDPP